MIIYRVNEVLFEKYDPSIFDLLKKLLDSTFLKELRIFSENAEIYIWNGTNGFSSRWRKDGTGDEVQIYEENHIIWGTIISSDKKLSEEFRGIEIKLPFTEPIEEKELPLKYKVYNYFERDEELGLLKFYDSRLVNFLKNDKKIIKE